MTHVILLVLLGLLPAMGHAQSTTITTARIDGTWVDVDQSGNVTCGDAIDYTVTVQASAAANALDTELVLPIDPFTLIDPTTVVVTAPNGSPQVRRADSVLDIFFGTVCGPGSCLPAQVSFRAYIAFNSAGPTIVEQGTVSASNAPAATTNAFHLNFASCFLTAADLSLTKTDGGITVDPGQTIPYTLTVNNVGTATAQLASLHETVPTGTTFSATASTPGWSCSGTAAGSTCTFALSNVPRGSSIATIFAVTTDLPFAGTTVSNTATVSSFSSEPNLANNTASDTTPARPGTPDLRLVKSLAGGAATPGAPLSYALVLDNLGNATAAGSALSETVPANTTFNAAASSTGWSCTSPAAGSTCTLALGAVAPKQSVTKTFAVTVANPLPAGVTSIGNTACASTSTAGDPAANNCSTVTTPAQGSPALSLKKSLASGSGTPGSTLVFNLTATNNGNQGAANVALTETVPANTTFSASASSAGWSCASPAAGSACNLALGTLAGGGASASRTFAVVIDNPLPAGTTAVQNSACATGSPNLSSCATITVPTNGAPSLHLVKTLSSGTGAPGSLLVYALTATNSGNQAAANLSLHETVPTHTTFVPGSSSPGWTCAPDNNAGSACTLSLPNLAGGGGSAVASFAVRIVIPLPAGVASIGNTACLRTGTTDADCDQISTPTTGSPVLVTTKTVTAGSAAPGAVLTYTITVQNTGDQDATGVDLSDQLPPNTTFVGDQSSPGWVCSPTSTAPATCIVSVGALPAQGSTSRTLAVRLAEPWPADGAAQITNRACATDSSGKVACATVDTPTLGAPRITLVKTYSGPPLTAGALLRFDLAVANAGNQVAGSVSLTDTVPAGSTFNAAASSPGWSCAAPAAGSPCTFTLANLAPGQTVHVTFAVTAANPLPATVTQISNAACAAAARAETVCSQTSTPLPVVLQATLDDTLALDANHDGFPETDDVLLYTLVVTNGSKASAADVVIALPSLDSHLTLLPESIVTSAGTVDAHDPARSIVTLPALAAGASVTITFRAQVAALPPSLRFLSTQGSVSGSNFLTLPTDDPATPESGDPTLTPLRPEIPVAEIPTLSELGLLSLAWPLPAPRSPFCGDGATPR